MKITHCNWIRGSVVLFILLISCIRDEVPPVVTSFSLKLNDTVRYSVPIELNAEDESGIRKIELYINDSLVSEQDIIPFSYTWNTNDYSDGEYVVKLKIFDREGNMTEVFSEVIVINYLIVIDASPDLEDTKYRIIVSDNEGNMLDTAAFFRSSKTILKSEKPYNGEAVTLLLLRKGLNPRMWAYINVRRGSVYRFGYLRKNETGRKVKLRIINDIPSFNQLDISSDLSHSSLSPGTDTLSIRYTTGHNLFLQLNINGVWFYRIVNIGDNEEITVPLSSVSLRQKQLNIPFPDAYLYYHLSGFEKGTDIFNNYYLSCGTVFPSSLNLWYIDDFFVRYSTRFIHNSSYTELYNGPIPTTLQPFEADMQITNLYPGKFNSVITGTIDYYSLDYVNYLFYNLQIVAPGSCKSWKLPEPSTILNERDFYLAGFSPYLLWMYDFESLDFSKTPYDISLDYQRLYVTDPHIRIRKKEIGGRFP